MEGVERVLGMTLRADGGTVNIHDELAAVFEERRVLGLACPAFDPYKVSEAVAERWCESLRSDLERDALVRRLVSEQHRG